MKQQGSFGAAMREARISLGLTQVELGARLQRSGQAVGQWESGVLVPAPATAFDIEDALKVAPGALSRHLGYVPVGAVATPQEAIEAYPGFDEIGRDLLLAACRAVEVTTRARRHRSKAGARR